LKKEYKEPKITINKVYTKKGDAGLTDLIGKHKVSKSDLRVKSYGELDELNSLIGGCQQMLIEESFSSDDKDLLIKILTRIQHEIFNLGNMIATLDANISDNMPRIDEIHLSKLEKDIDYYNTKLPALKSFVLPGGSMTNVWFHLTRTVARRSERTIVELSQLEEVDALILKYINRLSDAFFVWARWVIFFKNDGNNEKLWNPNTL
tara:strand:- start:4733 stop:5350 length:618 start_codon:yes stop_codon:yes gene_type:complete